MIDPRTRLNSPRSTWQIGTSLAAGFLIIVGVVFQLVQFGYDGLAVKNLWFLSMIGANIWNFLAVRSNLPALGALLRFWPLLLVVTGLALLAIPYSRCMRLNACEERISGRD